MTGIISAIIAGAVTLIGVLIANGKSQAVTDTKLEELTREVREHNNFARRVPILEEQMKMFLTRIGFNSKAVITGDVTQIDLPRNTKSGLRHAIEVLADVEEISFNFFHSEDVVRHPVVARIVNAYEAWEEAEQKRKAALAAERKREEQEQK